MDALQHDAFDPVQWIDTMLDETNASESKLEYTISSAYSQTQFHAQELSKALSRELHQVVATHAHTSLQLANVQSYANQLQHLLAQQEWNQSKKHGKPSSLTQLHALKQKLRAYLTAYEQRSTWTASWDAFETALEHKQYRTAAERWRELNELQPESDMVKRAQTRLSSLMMPLMRQAMHRPGDEASVELDTCVHVYEYLNQFDVVMVEWAKSLQAQVKQVWYGEREPGQGLGAWLEEFYAVFFKTLDDQLQRMQQVCTDATDTNEMALQLVKDIMEPLLESLHDRVNEASMADQKASLIATCAFINRLSNKTKWQIPQQVLMKCL